MLLQFKYKEELSLFKLWDIKKIKKQNYNKIGKNHNNTQDECDEGLPQTDEEEGETNSDH